MAKRGQRVVFHGAFSSKSRAVAKERKLGKGAYVRPTTIKGHRRYMVLTRRGR